MRILLINPNMTTAMTDQMAQIASEVAGPGTQITPLTATTGFPYIASRAEAQIAGALVLEMIADNLAGADAVIIAAFGDPGLAAARELFDLPVVGMAEAAVMSAAMLGDRFSVVTFSPLMARWYADCVGQTGLSARFTGVRCPDTPPASLTNLQTAMRTELIALATEAATKDGADTLILGGAPLAGLAPRIAGETPGILIDPIAAATLQAIALGQLAPSYLHRPARPAPKPSTGLGPALEAIIATGGSTHAP